MTAPAVDWQRIQAVVFDVDGTLYDQRRMRLRMARELALRCIVHPPTIGQARILGVFRRLREELADQEAGEIGRRQYSAAAERLNQPAERIREVVEEWILERPLRHVAACRHPGVRRLFAALHDSGRRIGVLSDYPAEDKLAALGLAADVVVSAVDPEVDRLKPRPEGLRRALKLLEVRPEEALVIGDRDDRDGACARRAGCSYLLLSRQPSGKAEFASFEGLLVELTRTGRE